MKSLNLIFGILFLLTPFQNLKAQNPKPIIIERTVSLSIEQTWQLWTTKQGLESFIAPEVILEPEPFGLLEVHFYPDRPVGQKGAENNRVLAIEEPYLFSFTWDAPVRFPEVRKQRTFVELRFESLASSETKVTLTHLGFGSGTEWREVHSYFSSAWVYVMDSFVQKTKNS